MNNFNLSTQVKSTLLLTTLLLGGCNVGEKISSAMGWCPNIPGQELYRGGQVYGDESGKPIQIRLDRYAIVTPVASRTYAVTEGQTMYAPDDGELNLQEWEEMTAMGPEALQPPFESYSKYGISAEPPYPEHVKACVERSGAIVLAYETLFPSNTKGVDSGWLKASVKENILQAEHKMNSRRWQGGGRERGS